MPRLNGGVIMTTLRVETYMRNIQDMMRSNFPMSKCI